jgi:integrase
MTKGLQLRLGKGWYLRLRVPADLVPVLGKREIVKRLADEAAPAWEVEPIADSTRREYEAHFEESRRTHAIEAPATSVPPAPRSSLSGQPAASDSGPTLTEALEMFLGDRRLTRAIGAGRERQVRTHFRQVLAVTGDVKLAAFGKDHARRVRDSLLTRGVKATYVNSVLASLGALFRWAEHERELRTGNPVAALRVPVEERESDRREAFTDEQLAAIWGPGWAPDTPSKRWVPALMLQLGMRPEEAAQLTVGDIDTVGRAVRVRAGDDKRAKTAGSERDLPLTPSLATFLDYVFDLIASGAGSDTPLFPELTPNEVFGRSKPIRNFFNDRLEQLGLKTSKRTLYSLRHTLATKLDHLEVPDYRIDDILGHAGRTTSKRVYRKRPPAAALFDHLSKVSYPLVF